ncbi:MAG: ZIP family metal transporter [Ktedonobacteraceae bacterium]|nr:ZIP family metal transporter [Ktedonobacteraceae bacterium]
MPTGTIILLGAFAGLTIYLGLPLAFLKNVPQSVKVFLGMLATGVLIFLLYDVISKASEPIAAALDEVRTHSTGVGTFYLDVLLLVFGIGLGSVGLVYFNNYVFGRVGKKKQSVVVHTAGTGVLAAPQLAVAGIESQQLAMTEAPAIDVQPNSGNAVATEVRPNGTSTAAVSEKRELTPHMLALLIATGIGLHNFSEGLAIGQSAAVGALQLAIVLIVGFGLHNMTEGFGIAGPLTSQSVSWKFIALLGLIGGGPTFLGTIVGIIFHSEQVFILFLALAAGAIIYVVAELLGVAKRFKAPEIVMWGLLIGFLLGYATDLIVTFGGA